MNISIRCRKWLAVALCVFAVAWTSRSVGQDLPTAKPEDVGVSSMKVEQLSTFMQNLVDDGKIAGGVTMMARHGKVIHLKAVGMADREEKKPMTTDAVFRIASMSKPITSVAVMMLWEQGKIGLDDPVSKYIPEFKNPTVLVTVKPLKTRPAKREITIRHLLTHTSGLAYNSNKTLRPIYDNNRISFGLGTTDMTLAQFVERLAVLPLLFDPGEGWEYGHSTDVLGRVVEVVSGVTLDRFIRNEVCSPLGMNDTFFILPAVKRFRMVAAYVPEAGSIRKLNIGQTFGDSGVSSNYHLESNKGLSGGGGLSSTAQDYMRFCQMLLNGGIFNGTRVLKPDTVKIMTVDQTGDLPNNFGFGFTIFPDNEEVQRQLRSAYAWFGYWSTSFRVSPRGDWIIVTMSQVAWDEKLTPAWFAEYERIAAESIID